MDDQPPVTSDESTDNPPEFHHEPTEPQAVPADALTQIPNDPACLPLRAVASGVPREAACLPLRAVASGVPREAAYRAATLQERFAAFFTDSIFFAYLLGGWALVLKYTTHGDLTHPFSFAGKGWFLFVTTGIAFHFLYYFFFEGVLTATPGKLLGGLTIQSKGGGTPSLFAIFIRNLFRAIDTPLFFLTGVGLIEATERRQRLGDLLARTVLVRENVYGGRVIQPDKAARAGATRRTLAFLVDLTLLILFFYGLLLAIPADRALVSLIALNLVPIATLFYITLSEAFFQTTVGKTLFGMKVVQEDGRPAPFSMLLVRNGFRLTDTNPIGYLCTVLSSQKQRPGDIAAGTLVVLDRRGVRGWLSIPFMLILAIAVGYTGYRNPSSFLKRDFVVRAGHYRIDPIPMPIQRLAFKDLHIETLDFGFNEDEVNKKALFDPGNLVYLHFTISGYTVQNDKAWVQADLKVEDQRHQSILNQANIINQNIEVGKRKSAHLVTRFALHPQALPGPYQVTLTLRDLNGNTSSEERRVFTVRP